MRGLGIAQLLGHLRSEQLQTVHVETQPRLRALWLGADAATVGPHGACSQLLCQSLHSADLVWEGRRSPVLPE
jgi:hypothetical protein